jgi:hypothetical protein
MSVDLRGALHDAVDGDPGGGPWDATDRLAGLTTKVRRRRAARAAATSAAGLGAACAVGAASAWWPPGPSNEAPAVASPPVSEDGDPVPPVSPVPFSESALCGAAVSPTSGADRASLGLPDVERDLELVGRSIGSVPVWLSVQADASSGGVATRALDDAQVVVVSGGRVVAVAEDAATVVSSNATTLGMLRLAQQDDPAGSGDLEACVAAPGTAGLAGHVPPAGDYTLHAVVDLVANSAGDIERIVSPGVALSLLPEQPLLAPEAPGLPEDFPLDVVPIVGGTVTDGAHFTSNRVSWKVTVEVEGDDALSRAVTALGSTGLGQWAHLTGLAPDSSASGDPSLTDPAGEARWWRERAGAVLGNRYSEGSASEDNVRLVGSHLTVNVRELPGLPGTSTLEYIVSRR